MKYTIRVCDGNQGRTSDDRIVCDSVDAKSPEEAVQRVLEKVNQFPGELLYADEVGHTPGPWVYDHNPKPMHNQIVIGQPTRDSEGGSDISEIVTVRLPESFCIQGEFERAYADARLIAAAPDLLAACEGLMRCFVGDRNSENCYGESGEIADKARLAIAKAKGQSRE